MAAIRCWHQAEKLAMKEIGGCPKDKYPCNCNNGKTTVTSSIFGSSDPPHVSEIICVRCRGTGFVSHGGYIARFIYCTCHGVEYNPFYARDGRRVFGNDTYLCGTCGMVVQFG